MISMVCKGVWLEDVGGFFFCEIQVKSMYFLFLLDVINLYFKKLYFFKKIITSLKTEYIIHFDMLISRF